jgi:hypothetical protein
MVEVIVFAEGPTEEQFIKRIIAPVFYPMQIFIKPQTLNTSQNAKGGAITLDRLKFNARNTLRQKPNAILTTFLDLYGLDTDFPGFTEAKQLADVYKHTELLETALHHNIIDHVKCRPERFFPHIQTHEFEALLFSDVTALCSTEPDWNKYLTELALIRDSFTTPEHINGSYETKPSFRLKSLLRPKFKKPLHGSLAAEKITLPKMAAECVHFSDWMNKLRSLSNKNVLL